MQYHGVPPSSDVRGLLSEARRIADAYRHTEWNDEHVLFAIVRRHDALLRRAGGDVEELRRQLSAQLESAQVLPQSHALLPSRRPAPRVDDLLARAAEQAALGRHAAVTVPHVLLALLEKGVPTSRPLLEAGVDVMRVTELSRADENSEPDEPSLIPGIGVFGHDLVELARRGQLDPVVGRDEEIDRVVQVLHRRTKNNPILIGDPGVGKTAIVEGIAQRVAQGAVPRRFRVQRIISLNVTALLANSGNRGEFEGRLHSLLEALRAARGSVVLFVDEAHLLIGAGASEGGLDAASILKPALARGDFALIGATTSDAYRRFIEPDAALERRLTPVWVREPSPAEATVILQRIRPLLESHHDRVIEDSALTAAVNLSVRYLPGRRLPDKAIDLLDEATSRASLIEGSEGRDADAAVGEGAVAAVVEGITGIPVTRLLEDESQRLLQLETRLRRHVFGQDSAAHAVSQAILRGRLGLADESRPIGAFLFAGPPGVGKTALAHALAEELFGDARALLRVDMSEFAESHSVARLLGAPPGYVGYNEPNSLTETIRRRPYQVVLFDSLDRAHEDTLHVVEQILESGRLTDGRGRVVDFTHSLVIITVADRRHDRRIAQALGDRLDDVVEFGPLDDVARRAIIRSQLERVDAATERLGLKLHLTSGAMRYLMEAGFSADAAGGRQLRRLIDDEVVGTVVRAVLADRPAAGARIIVSRRGGALSARCEGPARPPASEQPVVHTVARAESSPVSDRRDTNNAASTNVAGSTDAALPTEEFVLI